MWPKHVVDHQTACKHRSGSQNKTKHDKHSTQTSERHRLACGSAKMTHTFQIQIKHMQTPSYTSEGLLTRVASGLRHAKLREAGFPRTQQETQVQQDMSENNIAPFSTSWIWMIESGVKTTWSHHWFGDPKYVGEVCNHISRFEIDHVRPVLPLTC